MAGGMLGLVAAGCGPRLALNPVTGTVTLDGRPLGGVALGRHPAWIEVPAAAEGEPAGESAVPIERKPIVDVPARYLAPTTSGLGGIVSAGRNVIDLALVSGEPRAPGEYGAGERTP